MKCKIIKLNELSGKESSIYSIVVGDGPDSLYNIFLSENISSFKSELIDITKRLRSIGNKTGARGQYFKLNEGYPGDGVCALYDKPNANLRLYCIRFGSATVILGGGGENREILKHFRKMKNCLKKTTY